MVREVQPNIYLIEVPLPGNPLKCLNSYLIKGKKRNLLIDTGFNREECKKAMLEGLESLNVKLGETEIFVTHMHVDHSGLIPVLANDLTKVYCSNIDAHLINCCVPNCTGTSEYLNEMQKLLLMHGFPLGEAYQAIYEHPAREHNMGRVQLFHIFRENELLQVGDYKFKCVGTPGHSPGHMCLYEINKKFLISGDHILDEIIPTVKFTKWSADPLGNYLNSLDKIAKMDLSFALPAHGNIINNVNARVNELKQHHEIRLNEVLSIVGNKSRVNAYQVASKITWDVEYTSWEQLPVLLKYFAGCVAASYLIYLWNKNMVRKIDSEGTISFELIT
jgi:glyoxylase-like metal-dependent hydrolase (beta-lactamase superfamily II)